MSQNAVSDRERQQHGPNHFSSGVWFTERYFHREVFILTFNIFWYAYTQTNMNYAVINCTPRYSTHTYRLHTHRTFQMSSTTKIATSFIFPYFIFSHDHDGISDTRTTLQHTYTHKRKLRCDRKYFIRHSPPYFHETKQLDRASSIALCAV